MGAAFKPLPISLGKAVLTGKDVFQKQFRLPISIRKTTHSSRRAYSFTLRRRRALAITETELKLMAAAAKMGLSRIPKNG
jgi:hypothetical protein